MCRFSTSSRLRARARDALAGSKCGAAAYDERGVSRAGTLLVVMAGVPPPRVPNPFEDDSHRLQRLMGNDDTGKRIWRYVFIGGWLVLALWAVLAFLGLPDFGLVLAPLGLAMLIGSGIQLFIDRISAL
jgi:small-conductance mechanosensitive channel